MIKLEVELNSASFSYYRGSFLCLIIVGILPLLFSGYIVSFTGIQIIYVYMLSGISIFIAVLAFLNATFRKKAKKIVLEPNRLLIQYKNRKPFEVSRSEMKKVKFKYITSPATDSHEAGGHESYKFIIKYKNGKKKKISLSDIPRRKRYRTFRDIKKYVRKHYLT
jgi:hypothetical protein